MTWLSSLKIAIVEQNTEKIEILIDELPDFETAKELDEAQYLFKEAALLIHSLKNTTQSSMQQLQKNLTFLRSTENKKASSLDIKL